MRVEREIVDGFRTCGADRLAGVDCKGYVSEPLPVVREVITRTFGDRARGDSLQDYPVTAEDPLAQMVSDSLVYIRAVNEGDDVCPYCQGPASLSLEPRREYPHLNRNGGPEDLIRLARQEQRGEEQLPVAERQARALEALAARGQESDETAQLRALIAQQAGDPAELRERLEARGDDEPEPE